MPAIKGWGAEIIINRMHHKTRKWINRGFGPLPDIAAQVIKIAMREGIDRTGGSTIGQRQIGRCRRLIYASQLYQPIPFLFGGQSYWLTSLLRFPVAKGFGLMIIHLRRPVPRHWYFFGQQPGDQSGPCLRQKVGYLAWAKLRHCQPSSSQ